MSELLVSTVRTRCPAPWEPARPLGSRWRRMSDSVRFLASVAGFVTGGRTARQR